MILRIQCCSPAISQIPNGAGHCFHWPGIVIIFCNMGGEVPVPARTVFRFGVFDLDTRAAELRKHGVLIRLPGQSIQVLAALLERPGELVTREELCQRLWPAGTNVDFDHSLANAIKRIRDALGDSARTPRYIETMPRRGYRFLLPVGSGDRAVSAAPVAPSPAESPECAKPRVPAPARMLLGGILAAVVGISGFLALARLGHIHPGQGRHFDAEAYASYQRARYGPTLTRDSIRYFEEAIGKEPRFGLAYAGLSSTYIMLALHAEVSPREVMPQAREAAIRALSIDRGIAEAHLDLGTIKATFDWDRSGAEREFRRALELNPHLDGGHAAFALFLTHMGRFDEAIDQIAAFEKGPVGLQSVYANVLYLSRQYQRTIEYCQWALSFAPRAEGLQFWLARAYADQSRLPEAIEGMESARATDPQRGTGFGVLPGLYVRTGRRSDAIRFLDGILELAKSRYVSPVSIAIGYIGIGDFDRAFDWLEKGCLERDFSLSALNVDPIYDPIRVDPRFQSLLHRLNLQ